MLLLVFIRSRPSELGSKATDLLFWILLASEIPKGVAYPDILKARRWYGLIASDEGSCWFEVDGSGRVSSPPIGLRATQGKNSSSGPSKYLLQSHTLQAM